MSHLPMSIIGIFLLTTLVAFVFFTRAVRGAKSALALSLLWIGVQSAIALSGFYLSTKTIPPHLIVAIAPPLVVIAGLFWTSPGRRLLDAMDLKWCVLLQSIRILVELNLYWLFLYRQVPSLMTFEGGNLDILAGLTAPLIWWAFSKGHITRRGLLLWNTLCLLSVLNAFVRAILSAPFRFQQFAFEQPTIAILRFPFILLPAFLVPVVLLCHLVVFRKLSTHTPQ